MRLPTLIEDLPFGAYLADPADEPSLTSGISRELNRTAPEKVWLNTPRLNPEAVPRRSSTFDLGTAAHALFIGGGDPLVEVEAKDWRTNAAKEQRDAVYREGKTPVLSKDMKRVREMAKAAAHFLANTSIERYSQSTEEATIIWRHEGVTCRCRPDLLLEREAILHYKTTPSTVNPSMLTRYAAQLGWHVIHWHYHLGVKALTGVDPVQYFLIQETEPPYLCMLVQLDDAFIQYGEMDHERAVKIWANCLKTGRWTGHSTDVQILNAPNWMDYEVKAQVDVEPEPSDEDKELWL